MELKDFVRDTLSQLVEGVCAAQKIAGEKGAFVMPDAFGGVHSGTSLTILRETGGIVTSVEFDVALTTGSSSETRGGIGVFLGSVGLGSQGRSSAEASSLSRIKFQVPIVLPTQPPSRGKTFSE